MRLRVLVVESDPEDLLFLEEALVEIEEGRHWSPWADVECLGASTCLEAAAILSRDPVDGILLNPRLADAQGASAFRSLQALAPQTAIILLTEAQDRDLAAQLIREGAQDFIDKKQADCAPLAHAMRNAIERQRLLASARSAAMTDPLTGLLNRGGFYSLAGRDRRLAERLGRRLLLMVAEPRSLAELAAASGEHARDLALVEAAEILRGLAGSAGLLGRTAPGRFALALFDTLAEPVESAWARIHSTAFGRRIAVGAAIFEPDKPTPLEKLLEFAEKDLPLSVHASQERLSRAASVRP